MLGPCLFPGAPSKQSTIGSMSVMMGLMFLGLGQPLAQATSESGETLGTSASISAWRSLGPHASACPGDRNSGLPFIVPHADAVPPL